jgi:hypothetical protein
MGFTYFLILSIELIYQCGVQSTLRHFPKIQNQQSITKYHLPHNLLPYAKLISLIPSKTHESLVKKSSHLFPALLLATSPTGSDFSSHSELMHPYTGCQRHSRFLLRFCSFFCVRIVVYRFY